MEMKIWETGDLTLCLTLCACDPVPVPAWTLCLCDALVQILGNSDCHLRGNPFSQDGLRCDIWPHAVEFPIRSLASSA